MAASRSVCELLGSLGIVAVEDVDDTHIGVGGLCSSLAEAACSLGIVASAEGDDAGSVLEFSVLSLNLCELAGGPGNVSCLEVGYSKVVLSPVAAVTVDSLVVDLNLLCGITRDAT